MAFEFEPLNSFSFSKMTYFLANRLSPDTILRKSLAPSGQSHLENLYPPATFAPHTRSTRNSQLATK